MSCYDLSNTPKAEMLQLKMYFLCIIEFQSWFDFVWQSCVLCVCRVFLEVLDFTTVFIYHILDRGEPNASQWRNSCLPRLKMEDALFYLNKRKYRLHFTDSDCVLFMNCEHASWTSVCIGQLAATRGHGLLTLNQILSGWFKLWFPLFL